MFDCTRKLGKSCVSMRKNAAVAKDISRERAGLERGAGRWHCRGHRFDPGWLHQLTQGLSWKRLGPVAFRGSNREAPGSAPRPSASRATGSAPLRGHFRERLERRFDVSEANELLLERAPHARNTADVVNCLKMIAQLRSTLLSSTSTNEWSNDSGPRPAITADAEADNHPRRDVGEGRRSAFARAVFDTLQSRGSGQSGIVMENAAGRLRRDRALTVEEPVKLHRVCDPSFTEDEETSFCSLMGWIRWIPL
jgi:hypothetical protein